VPVGRQVLTRQGRAVYVGDIGDPIEDVDFDGVILSLSDAQKLKDATGRDRSGDRRRGSGCVDRTLDWVITARNQKAIVTVKLQIREPLWADIEAAVASFRGMVIASLRAGRTLRRNRGQQSLDERDKGCALRGSGPAKMRACRFMGRDLALLVPGLRPSR